MDYFQNIEQITCCIVQNDEKAEDKGGSLDRENIWIFFEKNRRDRRTLGGED